MVSAQNSQQVNTYYQKRYKSEQLAAMRPVEAYSVFLKYLKPKKGGRLLDVGCGTGYFLQAAEKRGLDTYGIDSSSEAVRMAKKVVTCSQIFQSSAEKLPFKNCLFDYVTCLGSLQYFPNMTKAIKEMKRVAKKKARFCFMVPNKNFLLWKIKGRNPKVLWGIDKNILSFAEWNKLWQDNQFQVLRVYKDNWLARKNILAKLFLPLLPLEYTYQYIFILKSK